MKADATIYVKLGSLPGAMMVPLTSSDRSARPRRRPITVGSYFAVADPQDKIFGGVYARSVSCRCYEIRQVRGQTLYCLERW